MRVVMRSVPKWPRCTTGAALFDLRPRRDRKCSRTSASVSASDVPDAQLPEFRKRRPTVKGRLRSPLKADQSRRRFRGFRTAASVA